MCCLGLITLYALRVNMSVAIVCMVNHTAVGLMDVNTTADEPNNKDSSTCDGQLTPENSTTDTEDGPFAWSKEEQGFILSGYFWGYIVTQIPGGWLSTRFGGKRVFGWFMLVGIIANLLIPVAAQQGFYYLMALRIIIGLSQGVGFPAVQTVLAHWTIPAEVSILCSFAMAGAQAGNVITFPIAGLLCQYGFNGGWPSIFYVLGACGFIWFLAWMILIHDSPEQHPRISEKEKKYITSCLSGKISNNQMKRSIPWLSILTSKAVWAIIIAHSLSNWGTDVFITMIPTYMKDVLKFNIKNNGVLSALPYIGLWVCMLLASNLADFVRKRNLLSPTVTRKVFNTTGEIIPAGLMIGTGFMGCNQSTYAVALLTLGVTMTGFQNGGGFLVNFNDIAPQYAGIIFGISNTLATIPGIIAPTVVDAITPHGTQAEWQIVFYITAGIYVGGAIIYLLMGSGEIQKWAVSKKENIELYVVNTTNTLNYSSEKTKL
ncbi:sialin [Patella vulgata]|uniref:sialin n=1 Tax=Patella vulgata TaxID=6465 RepID=UPI0024A962B6|nr:sialin [Patella vulgata]